MDRTKWKWGENYIASQFKNKGIYEVTDTSNNPEYWHKDIDMLVKNTKTNVTKAVEVKTDGLVSETGNAFIELANPRSRNGKGWLRFTEADYLAYLDEKTKYWHLVPLNGLKELVEDEDKHYRKITTSDNVIGLLIPVEDFKLIRNYRLIDNLGRVASVTL